MPDTPRRRRLATLAVGSIALAAGFAVYVLAVRHMWSPTAPPSSHVTFVDDRSCAQCHQAQYRAWVGSHHERAMQGADQHTVLGDFNNAQFTYRGSTARFFKREGRFFLNTEGADGTTPISRSRTRSASRRSNNIWSDSPAGGCRVSLRHGTPRRSAG
jgi:cytochrome c554/c'-like protein